MQLRIYTLIPHKLFELKSENIATGIDRIVVLFFIRAKVHD